MFVFYHDIRLQFQFVYVLLLEPIKATSRPVRQSVPFGEAATFNCVGYGSFLDISWRLSGDSICSHESCDHSALSYSESISSDNLTINATLEIDTSQLELDGVYPILCILQETVPAELGLEEGMHQFFSATLVITLPSGISKLCLSWNYIHY